MKEYIRKADIILALVLLVAGFGSLALLRGKPAEELKAVVYYEGQKIEEIALDGKKDITRTYEFGENSNTIKISNGSVWMEDADCSGKDCMQFGKISKSGQVIICAPHKLFIEITGGDGVDSTAY